MRKAKILVSIVRQENRSVASNKNSVKKVASLDGAWRPKHRKSVSVGPQT